MKNKSEAILITGMLSLIISITIYLQAPNATIITRGACNSKNSFGHCVSYVSNVTTNPEWISYMFFSGFLFLIGLASIGYLLFTIENK
jgi:hypothetical protein